MLRHFRHEPLAPHRLAWPNDDTVKMKMIGGPTFFFAHFLFAIFPDPSQPVTIVAPIRVRARETEVIHTRQLVDETALVVLCWYTLCA
jgi:hypothetical protein